MGIRNPEVLYTDGCRHINTDNKEVCGRPVDAEIHGPSGDHEYEN